MTPSVRETTPGLMLRPYQRLSTEVSDPESGLTARFEVYPSEATLSKFAMVMALDGALEHVVQIEPDRNGEVSARVLRRAIAITLDTALASSPTDQPSEAYIERYLGASTSLHYQDPPEPLCKFATFLVSSDLLPFRRSPISGQSIVGLLRASPGAGAGALLGAYLGIDHGFLLLATVPGGMIVGGSAMGVASALEKGLHERLLRIVSPPRLDEVSGAGDDDKAGSA